MFGCGSCLSLLPCMKLSTRSRPRSWKTWCGVPADHATAPNNQPFFYKISAGEEISNGRDLIRNRVKTETLRPGEGVILA